MTDFHKEPLPVIIEAAPLMATYLRVRSVTLIREDLLPEFGGKKRRSLDALLKSIPANKRIHLLSYDGSHTAFTLAQLTGNSIILYGKSYPGGTYRNFMSKKLSLLSNITRITGSLWPLLIKYYLTKIKYPDDYFMKIGGSVGNDKMYQQAAKEVFDRIGDTARHIVPVASGDLLRAIQTIFSRARGVLTQPRYLRIVQRLRLKGSTGILQSSIKRREELVHSIYRKTGYAFDPVFMGSVLAYCQSTARPEDNLCLWVTSPGIVKDYFNYFKSSGK